MGGLVHIIADVFFFFLHLVLLFWLFSVFFCHGASFAFFLSFFLSFFLTVAVVGLEKKALEALKLFFIPYIT